MFTLKVVGTGGAFARAGNGKDKRPIFNSNFVITKGDKHIAIDYGRTANEAFSYSNLEREKISHILVSHLHGDHIGGLEELAILSMVKFKKKQTIVSTGTLLEKLWENSLRGGLEFLFNSPDKMRGAMGFKNYFDLFKIEPQTWIDFKDFPGLKIMFIPTDHIYGMESYGFLIQGQSKKIFVSGDTIFDPEKISKYAEEAELIFHDTQILDSGTGNRDGVHAALSQLKTLPPRLKQKIYLYHYDSGEDFPDIGDEFAGFVKTGQEFRF